MTRLLIPVFLLFSLSVSAQSERERLHAILDTVITKTKALSLFQTSVDWDTLEPKIYALAAEAEAVADLSPALETMINALRDHHASIRSLADYSILAQFTDHENSRSTDERTYDSDTWSVVNDVNAKFSHEILPGNVGYLRVVGVGPNLDGQREAERIRAAIAELNGHKINHWIIDLRYNGGGNINVMMAGLAPLFDVEEVATIRDGAGNVQSTARIKKGEFWYFENKAFNMSKQPKLKNPKIAVLTSRWTVSSGELVAIAFKGQRNTAFFGEPTGGYTTNNCFEIVGGEISLILSTGYFSDRNGQIYTQHLAPENEVPFTVTTDKRKDAGIIAATNWLKGE